ncbi:2-oxo acid dehydrogenase subunit E2 [Propionibacterium freudenreichii]|nr:2-oxo acid dehydrogenase subunit E2 [Propionibacterium freudenreichii]
MPRWVTTLSISFDHRLIDGAIASRFLRDLAALVRDPRDGHGVLVPDWCWLPRGPGPTPIRLPTAQPLPAGTVMITAGSALHCAGPAASDFASVRLREVGWREVVSLPRAWPVGRTPGTAQKATDRCPRGITDNSPRT